MIPLHLTVIRAVDGTTKPCGYVHVSRPKYIIKMMAWTNCIGTNFEQPLGQAGVMRFQYSSKQDPLCLLQQDI